MKRARFTEEQIIGVLKEHEAGAKTADLARKHGVSEATLYNWKSKYGGMDVSEAKRYPKTIRVDQGSEFVSRDMDLWAYAKGVTLEFSRPGKPTDNTFSKPSTVASGQSA